MTEKQVFVVDDDAAVRDSLGFLLETDGLSVRTFQDPVEACEAVGDDTGCIVTDVRMPQMSGLDLIDAVRSRHPDTPILVITGHADVPMAVEAMKRGAADFFEKPFDDEALVAAVRRAAASRSRPQAIAGAGAGHRLARLSMRERQVLDGLMTGRTNKEIARNLSISPRTVEIHRANVMTKMEAGSYAELIRMGLKAGMD